MLLLTVQEKTVKSIIKGCGIMSILKIKDGNGNIIEVPAIKGDKGDPGRDGIGITNATITTEGDLVITYSNGNTSNLGSVKGENGTVEWHPVVDKITADTVDELPSCAAVKNYVELVSGGKVVTAVQTVKADFSAYPMSYIHCEGIGKSPVVHSTEESEYCYAVIPVKEGEVYHISGKHAWQSTCWFLTNSSDIVIRKDSAPDGVTTNIIESITVEKGEALLYINGFGFKSLQKEVTTYLRDSETSNLYSKKIIYDGDSICIGTSGGGGYAQLIANQVGGTYVNKAKGGGRLRTLDGVPKKEDGTDAFHSIVDNLESLPTDGDLYCFEGGINDYWTKGILGTYDYENFGITVDESGVVVGYDELDTDLDLTTVCGALEKIFRYALRTFVGKPICFIITHKIQRTAYNANSNGDTFKDYHDAMVGICEKYSIPYYDAFNESGLNGWNLSQNNAFLTGNSKNEPDGCHPNEEGYKRYYVPQLISLFESIMPYEKTSIEPDEKVTNVLDDVGYTSGIYVNGSGVETADEKAFTTGYIEVTDKGTVYLKSVVMPDVENSHGNRVTFYDEKKEFKAQINILSSSTVYNPTFSDGNLVQFYFHVDGTKYIRISTFGINDTSIITVNEPI